MEVRIVKYLDVGKVLDISLHHGYYTQIAVMPFPIYNLFLEGLKLYITISLSGFICVLFPRGKFEFLEMIEWDGQVVPCFSNHYIFTNNILPRENLQPSTGISDAEEIR